ncbi:T9SS type A sorting domain-containing protein [bacterium]|nr:T9SS type A sorting domain-containing protein [bacterium]
MFILAVLLAAALPALGQEVGDYRSIASGNWRTTTTWEMWDGGAWVTPTQAPKMGNNVLIRSGYAITFANSPDTCKNLVVEAGGVLYNNNTSNRYLNVYGDSVRNDGTIGGATDGFPFQCNHSVAFTGNGTYQVSRLRAGVPGITITFDRNFELHYAGAALYSNNNANVTFDVNPNDTLTFSGTAYFSLSTSSSAPSAVGGTFNIDFGGAVALPAGSNFNMSVRSGQSSLLQVDGDLVLGDTLIADCDTTTGSETVLVRGAITYASTDTMKFDRLYTNNSGGISFNFPVRVNKELLIGWGDYTNASGLTLANGVAITRYTGALTAAPVFEGTVSLQYGPNAAGTALTTGHEVPAADSTIMNVTFDNATGVVMDRTLSCYGTVTFQNGIVTTGSNWLGCYNQPVRTNGYVDGHLGLWVPAGSPTRSYFVGTANGYSPAVVDFINVTVPNGVGVTAFQSTHPDVLTPANTMQRYWEIGSNPATPVTFDSCSITLTYQAADFNSGFLEASDEGTMVVGKRDSTGWTFPMIANRVPNGIDDGGAIRVSNLTSLSEFTMAKDQGSIVYTEPIYSVPFTEGFEAGVVPPTDWTQVDVSGTNGNWLVANSGQGHPAHAPHGGTYQAYFNSWSCSSGNQTRLISPKINLSAPNCRLGLWLYHETGYSTAADSLFIEISNDGGSTWSVLGGHRRYESTVRWENILYGLAAYAGDTVQIGLRGYSRYGNDIFVDDVEVIVPPNQGPSITVVQQQADTYDGSGPFTVRAVIHDSAKIGIAADTLWYTDNATNWWPLAHTSMEADTYTYSIPGPIDPGTTIEYFFGAWDDQGAVQYDPSMYRGYQFRILSPLAPWNLTATPGDNQVQLQWAPPAQELQYDDGSPIYGYNWSPGDIYTTRFSPQHYPCRLEQVLSIWSNNYGIDSIEVHVWPDDGEGIPDTSVNLITPFKFLPVANMDWEIHDLSSANLVIGSGDFHVGYVCQTTDQPIAVSDAGGPGARSLGRIEGTWGSLSSYRDLMHRAVVSYSSYTKGLALRSCAITPGTKPLPELAGSKATPLGRKSVPQYPKLSGALAMAKNISGYTVLRGDVTGGPYTLLQTTYEPTYLDNTALNGNWYYYVVQANYSTPDTTSGYSNEASAYPTGVSGGPSSDLPTVFALGANTPNPVQGHTTVTYALPKAGNVRIAVYNVAGQKVKTLVDGAMGAGYHSVSWNGRNESGQAVSAGVYLYQMQADNFSTARKLVVVR